MANTFVETPGGAKSGKRLGAMAVAGLIGGGLGYLLSTLMDPDATWVQSESDLRNYTGLWFMLIIIGIGAGLVSGNAYLDGNPPSAEAIVRSAVVIVALGFGAGYAAQGLFSAMDASRTARVLAWGLAGAMGAVGIGLSFRSKKRLQNAVIGGAIGGLAGGFLFDLIPDLLGTTSDTAPQLVGICLIGLLIGALMAAVDAATSDMYLEVTSGELRGRQFLVMDAVTKVGSARTAGVVLLADRGIAEVHLVINRFAGGASFQCSTAREVLLNGAPVLSGSLQSGDMLRIGSTDMRVGFKKGSLTTGGTPTVAPPPMYSGDSGPRLSATQSAGGMPPPPNPAPYPPQPRAPSAPTQPVPTAPVSRPRLQAKPQD